MSTWTEWKAPTPSENNQGERKGIGPTSSGHVIDISDEKDNEYMNIGHRSGSSVLLYPNGDIKVKSVGNKQEIILADNQIIISGRSDVTVTGGASLRVKGSYDMYVEQNVNMVVNGNMETTVKGNMNTAVLGNKEDAIQGDLVAKVDGGIEYTAKGASFMVADAGLGLGSSSGYLTTRSATDTIMTMGATWQVTPDGATTFDIGGTFDSESGGNTTVVAPNIHLNP